ncbi:hypothetical protein OIV83_006224 [Microbotryomycetes sp. JL201]|nr:hypothetical protein OIV83_006224 [Microbotryomycetes sp. JL201]
MLRTTFAAARRTLARSAALTKAARVDSTPLARKHVGLMGLPSTRSFTSALTRRSEKAPESKPTEAEAEVRADQGLAEEQTPQSTMSAQEAAQPELAQDVANPVESAAQEAEDVPPSLPTESEADVRADVLDASPEQLASAEPTEDELTKRTVFVGGLSFSVDNEWLKDEILAALDVDSGVDFVRVARNNMGKSKGFAFIQLSTPELAEKLTELSLAIDGRPTEFRPSQTPAIRRNTPNSPRQERTRSARDVRTSARNEPSNTVWLGNVPWTTDESDIQDYMSQFGNVVRVSAPRDRETNRSRGIAYVQYESQEEAEGAVREAYEGQGLQINDRSLAVDYAEVKTQSYGQRNGQDRRNNNGRARRGNFDGERRRRDRRFEDEE